MYFITVLSLDTHFPNLFVYPYHHNGNYGVWVEKFWLACDWLFYKKFFIYTIVCKLCFRQYLE